MTMPGGSFFSTGARRNGIYVVVENVRSLFNVGAIFRSADGVGAAGVLLTGFTGCPPRKEISRVALGADETVPWAYYPTTVEAIEDLRLHGISAIALERSEGSIDCRHAAYNFPVAFVVGHEVEGVTGATIDACDAVVHIPMLGSKASLNVSVAAGIMFYTLLSANTTDPFPNRDESHV